MPKVKAVCLFFITASLKGSPAVQHIIFANFREVYEIPPDQVYFYADRGGNGDARVIRSYSLGNLDFRQWFGVCKRDFADTVRDSLLRGEEFSFLDFTTRFHACAAARDEQWSRDDQYHILDLPLYGGMISERFQYQDYPFFDDLNFPAYRDDVVDNLPKSSADASFMLDLFPFGFIAANELKLHLSRQTLLIEERLAFSATFHGERSGRADKGIEPSAFVGFVQDAPIAREHLGVVIEEDTATAPNAENAAPVDRETGIWIVKKGKPLWKGLIATVDRREAILVAGQRFVLLKHVDVNINAMVGSFRDFYGEMRHYSQEQQSTTRKVQIPEDKVFFRESFPGLTDTQYDKKVSDYFRDLLRFCAPRVLICDPYLLGQIDLAGEQVRLNRGQTAFLNALLLALSETKFEEICLLGMHFRTKKFWDDVQVVPQGYAKLFEGLRQIQKGLSVSIRIASSAFHNRRILKLVSGPTVLRTSGGFELSTSINGSIEGNELEVSHLVGMNLEKISHRVFRLWSDAAAAEVRL